MKIKIDWWPYVFGAGMGVLFGLMIAGPVHSAPLTEQQIQKNIHDWIINTLRPDRPVPSYKWSCCGVGDMYQARIIRRLPNGDYEIEITDGSPKLLPDGSHRVYIAKGTRVIVPAAKVNPYSDGNPTGEVQVFLNVIRSGDNTSGKITGVYCFFRVIPGS